MVLRVLHTEGPENFLWCYGSWSLPTSLLHHLFTQSSHSSIITKLVNILMILLPLSLTPISITLYVRIT